ncbi:MAG: hypothetical protein FWH49_06035 [Clostridiales bacterium]|nr:hypothetical protein [Clostridiales bacterium]
MKISIGCAVLILLITAGTVLPGGIAAGRDRMILGQIQSEALDAAELSDYVNISMIDKLSLLSQTTGMTFVPLLTGSAYDQDTVQDRFAIELERLHQLGLYPMPSSSETGSIRSEVTLYIQNDAPAINTIVWKLTYRREGLSGIFYLDDQTGRILSFDFSSRDFDSWVYDESLTGRWSAYLGVDVRNAKELETAADENGDRREALYSFELFSGSRVVGSQLSSIIQRAADKENRWSLRYLQLNTDLILGE